MTKRAGFTLVELLVVIVVGGLMLAAIYQTIIAQERNARHQGAVMEAQQSSRVALEILAAELREMSANDGDLVVAEPSRVRFRLLGTTGIVCNLDPAVPSWLDVVPLGLATFAASDSVLVFADRNQNTAADDVWRPNRLNSAAGSNTACPAVYPGVRAVRLQLAQALNAGEVHLGAPVRAFHGVEFRLLDEPGGAFLTRAEDGQPAQALLGPLRRSDASGLVFTYLDGNGATLSTPLSQADRRAVRRIRIHVRAIGRGSAQPAGYLDSLTTTVHLRGN